MMIRVSILMMTTLAATPALADCDPIANVEAILKPQARIFVGEMHGTTEMPRTFGALVCHATKKGPVRVGLELPATEDALLATYLASAGSAADIAALLHGGFWHREFQDGRSSVAMLRLIESIRALKRAGADVDIATFDDPLAKERDRAMAERAAAAIARAPKATWLLYAGNLHARKTKGRMPYTLMAGHLVEKGVALTTLDAHGGAGSAWVCFSASASECGPSLLGGGAPRPVAVTLARTADGAYDGTLGVGTLTFSPPAAVPMSKLQEAKAKSLERQRAARAAYDAKQFPRCAELYDGVAKELRSANDAYSAACCLALAGKADLAFAALSTAIEYGFVDDHGDSDQGRRPRLAAHGFRASPRWSRARRRSRSQPSSFDITRRGCVLNPASS